MRAKKRVFAEGLILILIWGGSVSGDVDVDWVSLMTTKHYTGGSVDPSPFSLWSIVSGSNVNSVQVTSPTGITAVGEWRYGRWVLDLGEDYATLADLREDFPVGFYEFVFNQGEATADSVMVYMDPEEPTGLADITYPAHGATDVPVEPTFTWESCMGHGDDLHADVGDEDHDVLLYEAGLDIVETSWAPGPLVLGCLHSLEVSVQKTASKPLTTDNGDHVTFIDSFGWENEVLFWVVSEPQAAIEEVLAFFDASVEAGTLVGEGPGQSADQRLNVVRKMLVRATALIDDGLNRPACVQLRVAYDKCDGDPRPPDFVSGAACVELAAMIQDVIDSLGCE